MSNPKRPTLAGSGTGVVLPVENVVTNPYPSFTTPEAPHAMPPEQYTRPMELSVEFVSK
jgi:hypothetical protein